MRDFKQQVDILSPFVLILAANVNTRKKQLTHLKDVNNLKCLTLGQTELSWSVDAAGRCGSMTGWPEPGCCSRLWDYVCHPC